MLTLRPYQLDLIDRARASMRAGHRRVLIQAPTGAGKTALIAQMLASAAARGKRAWFCVHRKELLDQSVTTFVEAADIHTGIIASGYPVTPLAPVQVCSVPTLAKRLSTCPPPDLIVWDEAHHLASRSWATIAHALPHAKHIGLTATPQRLDGKGLAPFFDDLICGPTTTDLIEQGWLAPYRLYAPSLAPNLDDVHRVAGDYNRKELSLAMEASTVVGDAVSHYRQHCAGGQALVFIWSLEASRWLADQFVAVGVPTQHVDGETSRAERTDAMRRFRDGRLRVLCNVELFGEGLDVPAVDAVFLLRPTQSLGLYLQQVGRGLRPASGKDYVRIFDHAGNWERHGLPDDPCAWSLTGQERQKSNSPSVGCRRCELCFAVSRAAARICAACGEPFLAKPRQVDQVAGTLSEASAEALRALRARRSELQRSCHTLAEWHALARRLGYKAGWGFHMWRLSLQHRKARTA